MMENTQKMQKHQISKCLPGMGLELTIWRMSNAETIDMCMGAGNFFNLKTRSPEANNKLNDLSRFLQPHDHPRTFRGSQIPKTKTVVRNPFKLKSAC